MREFIVRGNQESWRIMDDDYHPTWHGPFGSINAALDAVCSLKGTHPTQYDVNYLAIHDDGLVILGFNLR